MVRWFFHSLRVSSFLKNCFTYKNEDIITEYSIFSTRKTIFEPIEEVTKMKENRNNNQKNNKNNRNVQNEKKAPDFRNERNDQNR